MKKHIIWFILGLMLASFVCAADSITKDDIFTDLKVNSDEAEATFTLASPATDDLPAASLRFTFDERCGHVSSYRVYVWSTCQRENVVPVYALKEICVDVVDNKTESVYQMCEEKEVVDRTETVIQEYRCEKEVDSVPVGTNDYRIDADVQMQHCDGDKYGYEIDWVPSLEYDGKDYVKSEWAWWNASFTYCRNIEIQGANGTLSDFPVYINISNTTHINPSGHGVAFVNSSCDTAGDKMSHELANFTSHNGLYYVKVPTVYTTKYNISIYYEPASSTDLSDSAGTWSEFVGVFHLDEGSGATTKNSVGGVVCNISGADWVTGYNHMALRFVAASNDFVECPYIGTGGDMMLSVYINETTDNWGGIVVARKTAKPNYHIDVCDVANCGAPSRIRSYDGTTVIQDIATVPIGDWLAVQYRGTAANIGNMYRNSVYKTNGNAVHTAEGNHMLIGLEPVNVKYFNGVIDEVRILDSDKGLNWLNYTYMLYRFQSSFVTVGAEIVGNTAPSITEPCANTSIYHTAVFNCTNNATDLQGDALSWYVNSTLVNITLDGNLSDDPSVSETGCYDIRINVTDGSLWDAYDWHYCILDHYPGVEIYFNDSQYCEGESAEITLNTLDSDNDELNYSYNVSNLGIGVNWSYYLIGVNNVTVLNVTITNMSVGSTLDVWLSAYDGAYTNFTNATALIYNCTVPPTSYTITNTTLVIDTCPETIPGQMVLWLCVIITAMVVCAGLIMRGMYGGLFCYLGALLIVLCAFYINGCERGISYAIALVAVVVVIVGMKKIASKEEG